MTKRFIKVLGASALMAAAFSINAFADEAITSVKFASGADTEASVSSGEILSPVFVLNDANAEYILSSYSEGSSTSEAYKTARTYELTFVANEGYYFPTASEITVTGTGITEITSKKVASGDNTTLTVKCKAYPYYCWPTPEWKTESLDGTKVTFDRPSGTTVEYIIDWVSQSGEERQVHSTTTNSYITISSYNKAYTGSNEDYQDAHINGIAIRIKGSAGSNTRTAPSDWATIGSVDTSSVADSESYETWGDLFEGVTEIGGSGSSNSATGPSTTKLNGWGQGLGGAWYYYDNSVPRKGWLLDGGNWYYLDPASGIMMTGWQIVDGKRYYLNPNAGGPQGAMVTGTQVIDGTTYTFDASGAVM
ncbi:MAG: hypothetical protein Q4E57_05730 [Eubacteriales bacterium]|nr:hypothetical protein [Eubacteriales bacterium]